MIKCVIKFLFISNLLQNMIQWRSIMEEKNGTGIHWLIFSFVVVVTPILFGVFLSYIANKNLPKLEDLLTDIILMLFSI